VIPQQNRFSLESTLELFPDVEVNIEAVGYTEVDVEAFGEDADGRRGGVQKTISATVVQLWLYFPGRPPIRAAETPIGVRHWLSKTELAGLEELACEKAFLEDGEED
jgi:hypothetical protein